MAAAVVGVATVAGASALAVALVRRRTGPKIAPARSGPYAVASTIRRLPGGPAMMITYPAAEGGKPQPYLRPKARDSLASLFMTVSFKRPSLAPPARWLLSAFVGNPPSTVPADAPALPGKWPVVLFSHGIWGSIEMYSDLCAEMASFGAVVLALEHEDGSGLCAETAAGDPVPYSPSIREGKRDACVAFRKPFLAKRLAECEAVLSQLHLVETANA